MLHKIKKSLVLQLTSAIFFTCVFLLNGSLNAQAGNTQLDEGLKFYMNSTNESGWLSYKISNASGLAGNASTDSMYIESSASPNRDFLIVLSKTNNLPKKPMDVSPNKLGNTFYEVIEDIYGDETFFLIKYYTNISSASIVTDTAIAIKSSFAKDKWVNIDSIPFKALEKLNLIDRKTLDSKGFSSDRLYYFLASPPIMASWITEKFNNFRVKSYDNSGNEIADYRSLSDADYNTTYGSKLAPHDVPDDLVFSKVALDRKTYYLSPFETMSDLSDLNSPGQTTNFFTVTHLKNKPASDYVKVDKSVESLEQLNISKYGFLRRYILNPNKKFNIASTKFSTKIMFLNNEYITAGSKDISDLSAVGIVLKDTSFFADKRLAQIKPILESSTNKTIGFYVDIDDIGREVFANPSSDPIAILPKGTDWYYNNGKITDFAKKIFPLDSNINYRVFLNIKGRDTIADVYDYINSSGAKDKYKMPTNPKTDSSALGKWMYSQIPELTYDDNYAKSIDTIIIRGKLSGDPVLSDLINTNSMFSTLTRTNSKVFVGYDLDNLYSQMAKTNYSGANVTYSSIKSNQNFVDGNLVEIASIVRQFNMEPISQFENVKSGGLYYSTYSSNDKYLYVSVNRQSSTSALQAKKLIRDTSKTNFSKYNYILTDPAGFYNTYANEKFFVGAEKYRLKLDLGQIYGYATDSIYNIIPGLNRTIYETTWNSSSQYQILSPSFISTLEYKIREKSSFTYSNTTLPTIKDLLTLDKGSNSWMKIDFNATSLATSVMTKNVMFVLVKYPKLAQNQRIKGAPFFNSKEIYEFIQNKTIYERNDLDDFEAAKGIEVNFNIELTGNDNIEHKTSVKTKGVVLLKSNRSSNSMVLNNLNIKLMKRYGMFDNLANPNEPAYKTYDSLKLYFLPNIVPYISRDSPNFEDIPTFMRNSISNEFSTGDEIMKIQSDFNSQMTVPFLDSASLTAKWSMLIDTTTKPIKNTLNHYMSNTSLTNHEGNRYLKRYLVNKDSIFLFNSNANKPFVEAPDSMYIYITNIDTGDINNKQFLNKNQNPIVATNKANSEYPMYDKYNDTIFRILYKSHNQSNLNSDPDPFLNDTMALIQPIKVNSGLTKFYNWLDYYATIFNPFRYSNNITQSTIPIQIYFQLANPQNLTVTRNGKGQKLGDTLIPRFSSYKYMLDDTATTIHRVEQLNILNPYKYLEQKPNDFLEINKNVSLSVTRSKKESFAIYFKDSDKLTVNNDTIEAVFPNVFTLNKNDFYNINNKLYSSVDFTGHYVAPLPINKLDSNNAVFNYKREKAGDIVYGTSVSNNKYKVTSIPYNQEHIPAYATDISLPLWNFQQLDTLITKFDKDPVPFLGLKKDMIDTLSFRFNISFLDSIYGNLINDSIRFYQDLGISPKRKPDGTPLSKSDIASPYFARYLANIYTANFREPSLTNYTKDSIFSFSPPTNPAPSDFSKFVPIKMNPSKTLKLGSNTVQSEMWFMLSNTDFNGDWKRLDFSKSYRPYDNTDKLLIMEIENDTVILFRKNFEFSTNQQWLWDSIPLVAFKEAGFLSRNSKNDTLRITVYNPDMNIVLNKTLAQGNPFDKNNLPEINPPHLLYKLQEKPAQWKFRFVNPSNILDNFIFMSVYDYQNKSYNDKYFKKLGGDTALLGAITFPANTTFRKTNTNKESYFRLSMSNIKSELSRYKANRGQYSLADPSRQLSYYNTKTDATTQKVDLQTGTINNYKDFFEPLSRKLTLYGNDADMDTAYLHIKNSHSVPLYMNTSMAKEKNVVSDTVLYFTIDSLVNISLSTQLVANSSYQVSDFTGFDALLAFNSPIDSIVQRMPKNKISGQDLIVNKPLKLDFNYTAGDSHPYNGWMPLRERLTNTFGKEVKKGKGINDSILININFDKSPSIYNSYEIKDKYNFAVQAPAHTCDTISVSPSMDGAEFVKLCKDNEKTQLVMKVSYKDIEKAFNPSSGYNELKTLSLMDAVNNLQQKMYPFIESDYNDFDTIYMTYGQSGNTLFLHDSTNGVHAYLNPVHYELNMQSLAPNIKNSIHYDKFNSLETGLNTNTYDIITAPVNFFPSVGSPSPSTISQITTLIEYSTSITGSIPSGQNTSPNDSMDFIISPKRLTMKHLLDSLENITSLDKNIYKYKNSSLSDTLVILSRYILGLGGNLPLVSQKDYRSLQIAKVMTGKPNDSVYIYPIKINSPHKMNIFTTFSSIRKQLRTYMPLASKRYYLDSTIKYSVKFSEKTPADLIRLDLDSVASNLTYNSKPRFEYLKLIVREDKTTTGVLPYKYRVSGNNPTTFKVLFSKKYLNTIIAEEYVKFSNEVSLAQGISATTIKYQNPASSVITDSIQVDSILSFDISIPAHARGEKIIKLFNENNADILDRYKYLQGASPDERLYLYIYDTDKKIFENVKTNSTTAFPYYYIERRFSDIEK